MIFKITKRIQHSTTSAWQQTFTVCFPSLVWRNNSCSFPICKQLSQPSSHQKCHHLILLFLFCISDNKNTDNCLHLYQFPSIPTQMLDFQSVPPGLSEDIQRDTEITVRFMRTHTLKQMWPEHTLKVTLQRRKQRQISKNLHESYTHIQAQTRTHMGELPADERTHVNSRKYACCHTNTPTCISLMQSWAHVNKQRNTQVCAHARSFAGSQDSSSSRSPLPVAWVRRPYAAAGSIVQWRCRGRRRRRRRWGEMTMEDNGGRRKTQVLHLKQNTGRRRERGNERERTHRRTRRRRQQIRGTRGGWQREIRELQRSGGGGRGEEVA